MKSSRRRIGIMGGTFDPIHIGHLILAECAYEQFSLEQVLFIPAGNPPHKKIRVDGASDADRMEMVRIAIADNSHFVLSDEEMVRDGYTYTYETLALLNDRHPDTDYYFIIGGDSLMTFDTWMHPELIAQRCILVAAVRDQLDPGIMNQKKSELQNCYGADIRLLNTPDLDIASSRIRSLCKEQHSIRYYVPDPVREYINTHKLYTI